MRTDYIDLGMIHYVDEKAEFERVMQGAFIWSTSRPQGGGDPPHRPFDA